MKALFNRVLGGNGKPKDKLAPDTSSDNRSFRDKAHPPIPAETSSSSLPNTPEIPERELPPITTGVDNIEGDPNSLGVPANFLSTNPPPPQTTFFPSLAQGSNKRVSVHVDATSLRSPEATRRASQQHLPQLERIASRTPNTSSVSSGNTGAGRSHNTDSSQPPDAVAVSKKVAFISPAATTVSVISPFVESPSSPPASAIAASNGHLSASVRSPVPNGSASGRQVSDPPPRIGGYTPGTTTGANPPRPPNAAASRHASNAYVNEAVSVRSGTSLSYLSGRTGIQAAASWGEAAEEDLVSNLGARERTRQEVLWEIVASEDRYVVELLKLKETFIDPLLHPFSSVPLSTPGLVDPLPDYNSNTAYFRSETPMTHRSQGAQPRESIENLPIASRFLSTSSQDAPPSSQARYPQQAIRKRSNLAARPPGVSTPVIPDDEEDANSSQSTDDEEDALGRGHAPGANRLPVRGSPYGARSGGHTNGILAGLGRNFPFPSGTRSHQSLPPPPRTAQALGRVSTTSLTGAGGVPHTAQNASRGGGSLDQPSSQAQSRSNSSSTSRFTRRVFGGVRKDSTESHPPASAVTLPPTPGATTGSSSLPPHLLPEDLRKCLEVLEGGLLNGHAILSDGLRKRYEEQYPLVRSLADVFVSNSHILRGYATYVLHLERALEQVDDALSVVSLAKKPKKQDIADWMHVSRVLRQLEDSAAEKGETGLAISLSKPFQRLLKYPLLFQNLLFHTDPSTFEYESTLEMVAEVEKIVRSIEDEKIQQEERDKTRDVLGRIEGLEKNKALAAPKPSRQLVEEKPLFPPSAEAPPVAGKKSGNSVPPPEKKVQTKSSFRRFSDALQPGGSNALGGKRDLWLVVFNDVVLRCQRTGTTTLPTMASSPASGTSGGKTHPLPEPQAKAKYSTVGRRNVQTKPRNLYKFVKIEHWTIGDVALPAAGVVAMEAISKTRSRIGEETQKPFAEHDEENVSDDSDRKSKMSFSYWGADKVTIQSSEAKARGKQAARNAITARRGPVPVAYSTANAKFGTRLRSPEPGDSPNRPASRRTGPAPSNATSVRKASTDKPPAWGSMGNARPGASQAAVGRRTQKLSTPTPPKPDTAKPPQPPPSPAPSELTQDSGVGLYRDVIAQYPALNRNSAQS